MRKPYLAVIAVSAGICGLCGAQTLAVGRNTLTNHGIVTLAKAGFNEEFIIDTILSSRTQFDTSVDGLADLAKQGITERLIRVMMNPAPNVAAPGAGIAADSAPAMPFGPSTRAEAEDSTFEAISGQTGDRRPYAVLRMDVPPLRPMEDENRGRFRA